MRCPYCEKEFNEFESVAAQINYELRERIESIYSLTILKIGVIYSAIAAVFSIAWFIVFQYQVKLIHPIINLVFVFGLICYLCFTAICYMWEREKFIKKQIAILKTRYN